MKFTFLAQGHPNITSQHKSTFEITTDKNLTLKGDCIIGLNSEITLENLPQDLKDKIKTDNTPIEVVLKTDNSTDKIVGFGSSKLTLTHPTDMVIRKSSYTCSRTLMIKSDKASIDLDRTLINDLKNGSKLEVTIKVD